MSEASDLRTRDSKVCWHPFTQHQTEHGNAGEPLAIQAAQGAVLRLEDGREILDGISSWWAVLHGHGRKELLEAMGQQAARLDHVLFAGATHEPAVGLAERLCSVAPEGLSRVFYSDDGSTAVEVAVKMAYQRWVHRGEPERRVFIALEGGYHGDTFGAMSLGDPDPYFLPFAPLLFEVHRCAPDADSLREALESTAGRAAGLVMEPLVQGAAGMKMHAPEFLVAARELTETYGIPLIADEVLTGFGRTGTLFACNRAGISPDLLCLAKGLTGGLFPMSATLATEEFFESFLSDDRSRAFFHGHTFTAHPVGCAVALASLQLTLEEDVPGRMETLGRSLLEKIQPIEEHPQVRQLRQRGGIVAFELSAGATPAGYLSSRGMEIRRSAISKVMSS